MTPYISTGISIFEYYPLRYAIGELEHSAVEMPLIYLLLLLDKIKPLNDFILSFEITANHSFTDNLTGVSWKNKKLLHIILDLP